VGHVNALDASVALSTFRYASSTSPSTSPLRFLLGRSVPDGNYPETPRTFPGPTKPPNNYAQPWWLVQANKLKGICTYVYSLQVFMLVFIVMLTCACIMPMCVHACIVMSIIISTQPTTRPRLQSKVRMNVMLNLSLSLAARVPRLRNSHVWALETNQTNSCMIGLTH